MKPLYFAAIGMMVAAFIAGVSIGCELNTKAMQVDAVKAGVGEWVIIYEEKDFSDVKRGFRWKALRK